MTERTEKMIAKAEAKGRAAGKAHMGQVASNGVPFRLVNPYGPKYLRAAWQRGVDMVVA